PATLHPARLHSFLHDALPIYTTSGMMRRVASASTGASTAAAAIHHIDCRFSSKIVDSCMGEDYVPPRGASAEFEETKRRVGYGEGMSVSELSTSAQNYLKAIWSLAEWSPEPVTTSAIAERVGVRLSTVSDAVRKLADQGLLEHTR